VDVCSDEIDTCAVFSKVFFKPNRDPDQMYFYGGIVMTEGNLASDFRTANATMGAVKVTVGVTNPVVVYDKALNFAVTDYQPGDNWEKWRFWASSRENMTIRWKDTQYYVANRDPNLPVSVGSLSTLFI